MKIRTNQFNRLFCSRGENENEISLKTSNSQALAQIILMKQKNP